MENVDINSKCMSKEPVSVESVTDIIRKFENHNKNKGKPSVHFCFLAVELKDVNSENDSSDPSKAIQQNDIPTEIKQTVMFFLDLLCIILTNVFSRQGFLTFSNE